MQKLISRRQAYASVDRFRRARRGSENALTCVILVAAISAVAALILWSGFRSGGGTHLAAPQPEHVLVFDCGSTGTRLNIIRVTHGDLFGGDANFTAVNWQDFNVPFPGYTPKKHGYNRIETFPGIHQAAAKGVHEVKKSLQPLLDWAKQALRQHPLAGGQGKLSDIPVLLFATAGVRKLAPKDQKILMNHIIHVLSTSGFRFQPDWATIITGEDEGIFSWVSSNFKLGNFQSEKSAMNMLELGGSSLQGSYVTNPELSSTDSGNRRSVTVLGRSYDLEVESFNGYGMNDAFNSTLYYLWDQHKMKARGRDQQKVLIHPCLQEGYSEKEETLGVTFRGNFDSAACRGVVLGVFGEGNEIEDHHTSAGFHEAKKEESFIALAGFFLVYSFFDIDLGSTLSEALAKAGSVCRGNYMDMSQEDREDRNAGLYCFRQQYIEIILREWMKLRDEQIRIYSESEWALGAAILLLEKGDLAAGDGHGIGGGGGGGAGSLLQRSSPTILFILVVVCAVGAALAWRRRMLFMQERKMRLPLFSRKENGKHP